MGKLIEQSAHVCNYNARKVSNMHSVKYSRVQSLWIILVESPSVLQEFHDHNPQNSLSLKA